MRFFFIVILSFLFTSLIAQTKADIDAVNELSYNDMIADLEGVEIKLKNNILDAESIGYLEGKAKSNEKLGIVYFYLRDIEKGMQCSVNAVSFYEDQGDYERMANSYADIGFAIKEIDKEKGLFYFRKAIEIAKNHDVGLTLAKIYNNYGTTLKRGGNLDSAYFYHLASLEVCKDFNDSLGIPYSLNNLVEDLSEMGRFDEAIQYMNESDVYRKLENNDLSWADNLSYRGDIYYGKKDYDSAILYYSQSLQLGKETKFVNLVTYCLERLSSCYEFKNDASNALKYFKELKLHEDSLITVESNKAIASIQEEFEVTKKEKKIAEQDLQLAKQKNRFYLITGASILVTFLAILIFLMQRKRRKEAILKLQHTKDLEKAKMEKEFVDEKLRIGRELHDNIGSQLTFMISSVDNLLYLEEKDDSRNRLNKISDFGRTTMKELRSTIWAMKNDGGSLKDLILKINELKLAIPNSLDVQVINNVKDEVNFNALQLLNLYRIVQEALQNVVKYSEADVVKIIFDNVKGIFILKVVDNGNGFDAEQAKEGNGLNNMQRRCEESGGLFKLVSSEMGTEVICQIKL